MEITSSSCNREKYMKACESPLVVRVSNHCELTLKRTIQSVKPNTAWKQPWPPFWCTMKIYCIEAVHLNGRRVSMHGKGMHSHFYHECDMFLLYCSVCPFLFFIACLPFAYCYNTNSLF